MGKLSYFLWRNATELGCPFQRYSHDVIFPDPGAWIALGETPPCRRKTCGKSSCHLYGKKFKPDYPDRFFIAKRKEQ